MGHGHVRLSGWLEGAIDWDLIGSVVVRSERGRATKGAGGPKGREVFFQWRRPSMKRHLVGSKAV